MVRGVIVMHPDEFITSVAEKLSKNNISGAPVVDKDRKIVGVVSEFDILKYIKNSYASLAYPRLDNTIMPTPFDLIELPVREAVGYAELTWGLKSIESVRVSEIMSKRPIIVKDTEDINEAARIMITRKINRLPVQNSAKKLVGIITRGDVIHALARERTKTAQTTKKAPARTARKPVQKKTAARAKKPAATAKKAPRSAKSPVKKPAVARKKTTTSTAKKTPAAPKKTPAAPRKKKPAPSSRKKSGKK